MTHPLGGHTPPIVSVQIAAGTWKCSRCPFTSILNSTVQAHYQHEAKAEADAARRQATYRVGNHQPRNVYRGDTYIGVMFDPADAAAVVDALNKPCPAVALVAAVRAFLSRVEYVEGAGTFEIGDALAAYDEACRTAGQS